MFIDCLSVGQRRKMFYAWYGTGDLAEVFAVWASGGRVIAFYKELDAGSNAALWLNA